jgi:hypothetical protein
MRAIIQTYRLNLDPEDANFTRAGFWQNTLLGQRRELADLVRLQLYGILWAATGVDQYYPLTYEPPLINLPADESFHELKPPALRSRDLSMDVLQAGFEAAGDVPLLLVDEPIFQSNGENSDIRYNFFYPRWVFDQYRDLLASQSTAHGWHYLDLWDLLPSKEFTNSAIHVTPAGEAEIANKIENALHEIENFHQ